MTKFNRSARAARLARRTPRSHTQLAAAVVASYVSKNPSDSATIGTLLSSVHSAFVGLGVTKPAAAPVPLVPATSIKRSVRPDYIVCLEDGRKMKSMKGHLRTLGMTPEQYRAKWGLPSDYPMVAPNYSARRTAIAKEQGLGLGGRPRRPVAATVFLDVAATISPDGIVNLLDGRIVRDLGREVARSGITSDDYRIRFGLPANYPMKVSRAGPFLKALASA